MGRLRLETVQEADVPTPLQTEYGYDPDGEISSIVSPAGLYVKYERDPVTKAVTEVRNVNTGTKYASNVRHLPSGPITDLVFAGGATLAQAFNLRYEPSAIQSGQLGSTSAALELSYNVSGSGLMLHVGSTSYTYDKRDRLETVTPLRSPPYVYVFPYDNGAWLAVNDRPQEARSVAGNRALAFGYDDGSNLSAISKYDDAGASITSSTCFVHDALGRLTAVGPAKMVAGPDARACKTENDLASVTARFRYDARNRRIARQDGAGPWKVYVSTPDGALLAELTKPTTSGEAWGLEREYVWLEGRPLAQIEYPGPVGGNEGYVYLVHVDHLGQPRALTTKANAVVWAASPPRPYGDIDEATTADIANGRTIVTNLRLPGQYDERLLAEIGLKGPFYNGQRWYLPQLARYMELDPIALRGGLNGTYAPDWYGYGNANPVRWTDPNGEFALLAPAAVMGMVFGGIYGGVGAAIAPGATWKSVVAGAGAGVIVGGLVGAYYGSGLGVGGAALVGGGAAAAGSWLGQTASTWLGSGQGVNPLSVFGAGVGGLAGGTLQGLVGLGIGPAAATGAGAWGAEALGNFVGGIPSMAGDLIGTHLSTPSGAPNMKPWQDTGTSADWLRAAGCKPP